MPRLYADYLRGKLTCRIEWYWTNRYDHGGYEFVDARDGKVLMFHEFP